MVKALTCVPGVGGGSPEPWWNGHSLTGHKWSTARPHLTGSENRVLYRGVRRNLRDGEVRTMVKGIDAVRYNYVNCGKDLGDASSYVKHNIIKDKTCFISVC